jgi:hypothetical protein
MTIRLVIEIDDDLGNWTSRLEPGSLKTPPNISAWTLAFVQYIRASAYHRGWAVLWGK